MKLDNKLRRLIIAKLRKIDFWSKARAAAKKAAKGRCCSCKKKVDHLMIDHIVPVFDPREADPFTTIIETCPCAVCRWFRRLFVGPEGRQPLCKECHQIKTNAENTVRRERQSHDPKD